VVTAGAVSLAVADTATAAEHAGIPLAARLASGVVALAVAVAVLGRGVVSRSAAGAAVPSEATP
jgi:hypothetical protein